ncbi:MAG TPA: TlpA disulfide reductase family protein, partial [Gemmatimonadaceae bacterium]
ERFMFGQAHADSTAAEHCARLQRFDAQLRAQPHPTPAEVSSVRAYSVQLDYQACPAAQQIARVWRDWLVRDTSSAPEVLVWRYQSQLDTNQPARGLALAERFWPAPSQLAFLLYNNGLNFAIAAKDSSAILRWADRNAAHSPANAAGIYTMILMRAPMVRDAAVERLRSVLGRLQTPQDSLRPLERTTVEQARVDSATAREIMATIGDALVSQGKIPEGLDSLERATSGGWDPALFRRVARTALKIGKTELALPLLARVAVDPSTSRREADSLSTLSERFVSHTAWAGALHDASEAMRTAVMADATIITLEGSLRLQTTDATTQRLGAALGGRVGVVTFWSRFCAPSLQQLTLLPAFAHRLDSAGVALVAITDEAPSPAVRAFVASSKLDVPVHHDTWGEAGRAFQVFGTPQYFVVDERGRIRFRYTTLDKALTQAVVLTAAARAGTN